MSISATGGEDACYRPVDNGGMNGAQALIRTLTGAGVEVCFSNPGTSEMHFVAALDTVPQMRGVLCLFEGVATGAADGYGRMTGRPAAALLHLGPGLANGLANLHNARRAGTPLVTVVGDHATFHKRLDAPLESDIDALAGSVSGWVRRSLRSADVAGDAAEAVAAASAGAIATLILPADVSWSQPAEPAPAVPVRPASPVPDEVIGDAAKALRSGEPCLILLGGTAVRRPGLEAASRIAAATGARLLGETFPARLERGAGLPAVDRLAYLGEMAAPQLAGTRHLILAGAKAPVTFFAYPGTPSSLVPDGCEVHTLAGRGEDVPGALAALAGLAAAGAAPARQPAGRPAIPDGALTAETRRGRHRRAAAGARHRVRRVEHVRVLAERGDGRGPAARLAHADRRGHRAGTSAGRGGRDRVPGPAGPRAGIGRQRDVHDLGAVDARPPGARRHHGDLQQPVLRHPGHGAGTGRRGPGGRGR